MKFDLHRSKLHTITQAVLLCGAVSATSMISSARTVWTQLEPANGQAIESSVPATFPVFFEKGSMPASGAIVARVAGATLSAQIEPKRTYEDGSVKYALVSVVLPSLAPDGVKLEYAHADTAAPVAVDTAAQLAKLLASDFDASISFRFLDGTSVAASAREMLQASGANASHWLSGPVATEWLLMGAPKNAEGIADPDLIVQFQVRFYPQSGHTRVSAVIEKCSDQGSNGGLVYDVLIEKGHKEKSKVFEVAAVPHADLMRWREVFWLGEAPAEILPRMDVESMIAAGVLPPYDLSLKVPEDAIASMYKQ